MSQAGPCVYVIDDDQAVRGCFMAILSAANLRCAGFESAVSFLQAYRPEQRGCLLLDLQMPGMTGIELQRHLKMLRADIPVIFLSAHADIPSAVQAMRAGAFDFIIKPVATELLLSQVKGALEQDAQQYAALQQQELAVRRFLTLTSREKDVLSLLLAGHSNKAMASDLHLSRRTVELYRARIMVKTGSHSLAELVRTATGLDLARPAAELQTLN